MKRKNRYKLYSIILILMTIVTTTFKTVAQKKTEIYKDSKGRTFNKKPTLEAKLADNLQLGKPIELNLTIKNKTKSVISIFDAVPERGFDIIIKDAKGLTLSLTEKGQKKKFPNIVMGRAGAYVKAGKELTFRTVRLDELFDFKHSGSYTLEVKVVYYLEDNLSKDTNSEIEDHILTSIVKFDVD